MTSTFDLLPAIDLVAGRVVRLDQGDFERETRYGDDPIAIARRFIETGSRWLHVVDLDGARSGEPRQEAVVAEIVAAVGTRAAVEVAGGLRSMAAIDRTLGMGATRVVLGTAALQDPDFAGSVIARHGPERVAVALDVRAGRAIGEGWRAGATGRPVATILGVLLGQGVTSFEVTAVDRDGTRAGPDLAGLGSLVGPDRSIIAAGGVASIDDLLDLRGLGCSGAILGRALYEGDIALDEALSAVGG